MFLRYPLVREAFDETFEYQYIGSMKPFKKFFFFAAFLAFSLTGCSFNYTEGKRADEMVPDMILADVIAYRYENSELSIQLSARELEMYDTDEIWAGADVSFVQYDTKDSSVIEAEGSAGFIIVNDSSEEYLLGKDAVFHLARDNFFLRASGLKWNKKEHTLSGPVDGDVVIEKEDGSLINGTGFTADTLQYSYSFNNSVQGLLVTGISETEELAETTEIEGDSF